MKPENEARPVEPPGLERKILRKMPAMVTASLIVPFLFFMAARYFWAAGDGQEAEKLLLTSAIVAVSVSITLLSLLLALGIGCVIVILMKGPPRTADSYPLIDSDRPRPEPRHSSETDHSGELKA